MKLNSKTVGIIGGGQLGMMLAESLKKLGAKVISLDPNSECSITHVCDSFICAPYDDLEALERLCASCDVVTYEFENIKGSDLKLLNEKYNIKQGIKSLVDSQDRLIEKDNANKHGLKTVKYFKCNTEEDLNNAIDSLGLPCVYKTRREGYDGHGQVVIKTIEDKEKVKPYLGLDGIVEEYLKFDYEASVIMIGEGNKIVALPVGHNIHKDGILDICEVPFNIPNEMAPRPHNSGHYSIEALNYSQYDLFARYLLDLDYEEPKIMHKAIMKNILGVDLKNVDYYLKCPNSYLHMYYKKDAKPQRKMGHITFLDMTLDEFLQIEKGLE